MILLYNVISGSIDGIHFSVEKNVDTVKLGYDVLTCQQLIRGTPTTFEANEVYTRKNLRNVTILLLYGDWM